LSDRCRTTTLVVVVPHDSLKIMGEIVIHDQRTPEATEAGMVVETNPIVIKGVNQEIDKSNLTSRAG